MQLASAAYTDVVLKLSIDVCVEKTKCNFYIKILVNCYQLCYDDNNLRRTGGAHGKDNGGFGPGRDA